MATLNQRVIYKYSLGQDFSKTFELPGSYRVLSFQIQNGEFVVWVEIDLKHTKLYEVNFSVVGTGQGFNLSDKEFYLGTVQDGEFVWHAYYCELGERVK